VALTDKQISSLNEHVNKFKAANYKVREKFVKYFLGSFKSTFPEGINDITVETVHGPSAILGYSHKFLAYSPAPIWKNQIGKEEILPQNSRPNG
jgi:hypothetical protein